MTGKRRRLWVNIETVLGECHGFAQSSLYNRLSDGLVLSQRRGRLTCIEPAMDHDAGPTLNQNLMGRPTISV